jgi:hypothetical protein
MIRIIVLLQQIPNGTPKSTQSVLKQCKVVVDSLQQPIAVGINQNVANSANLQYLLNPSF